MKINLKRTLSLLRVFCLCMGTLPTVALAAEPETVTNTDGTTSVIETTTSDPVTDEATGNVTITVTVTETTTGTNTDGQDVTGTKITETVTVTDSEGNVISSSEEETGSEKKEWTEEYDGNGEQTPVEVELVPGETTTGKAEPTETTGDDDKTDGEWNYTETTTTDRTVEATTSEITTSSTPGETTFDDVAPDDYEGKEYITDKTPEKSPIAPEAFEKTEGDFLFSGNRGEMSIGCPSASQSTTST